VTLERPWLLCSHLVLLAEVNLQLTRSTLNSGPVTLAALEEAQPFQVINARWTLNPVYFTVDDK
jgi:hypothetical protein